MNKNNNCRWQDGEKCTFFMPDSLCDCDKENCELKEVKMEWDYKFGKITPDNNIIIDELSPDAEIVTNEAGGKQSKVSMAMHLIDPAFLYAWYNQPECNYNDDVIREITDFMRTNCKSCLLAAIFEVNLLENKGKHEDNAIITIAKVLQYGASRYAPNNWRLIPQEEHINHALIHYVAYKLGDTQDAHLAHCMCRLMMAYATEKSSNFEYGAYVN